MTKYILLALILAAVWYIFFRRPAIKHDKSDSGSDSQSKPKGDEEVMVSCATCNTFISTREALLKDGKYYCSPACRDAK